MISRFCQLKQELLHWHWSGSLKLPLWEKKCPHRNQHRMFYDELLYRLPLLPSRDQTGGERKLNCDEEPWVFIFMAGSLTYLLSCLSPICASDGAPKQCDGAKWSANGFPIRIVSYNPLLLRGDCCPYPRSTGIYCTYSVIATDLRARQMLPKCSNVLRTKR